MEVSIQCLMDDLYWDGSIWSMAEKWLPASGTALWTYDSSSILWTSGASYIVRSRAIDIATNVENPIKEYKFIIDFENPYSIIDVPADRSYLNKLNTISGRAFDTGNSTIKEVEINIIRSFDDLYWNGTNWADPEKWFEAEGTSNWVFDSTNVIWDSDARYIVRSKVTDNATNFELPGAGNIFYIDLDIPSSTIDLPTNNSFLNRLDVISGTSQDRGGSDLSKIKISIIRAGDEKYWDGTDWSPAESWLSANGTTEWSYDTSKIIWTSNSEYLVSSRAEDHATNVESPTYGERFLIDLESLKYEKS